MAWGSPSILFWAAIFDPLTRVNDMGQPIPLLASSWTVASDKLTWTFALKRGIKFSNGEPMNADAVVAAYKYLLFNDEGLITYISSTIRGNIADVTKVDEYTIALRTKTPDPLIPGTVATVIIVAPKMWADVGSAEYANSPATTGPYKVEAWSDQEAVFVLDKDSYRPGNIPRLTITAIPEPVARSQALVSEQIDIATTLGPQDLERIRAAGHVVDVTTSPTVLALGLFQTDFSGRWGDRGTPFLDKRVRQALNYAIDRDAIVENLAGGITKPASQPANPSTFGFNPDVKPYPYDPVKARALLAEAGYPDGFKFISEVLVGIAPNDKEIFTYVADSLARIGVEMELRPIPFSDWLTKFLEGKWEGESTNASFVLEPHLDAIRPFQTIYSCELDHPFVCFEDFKPFVAAASQEMDPSKREQLLKNLMKKASDDRDCPHDSGGRGNHRSQQAGQGLRQLGQAPPLREHDVGELGEKIPLE